jgi:hypothetical protein
VTSSAFCEWAYRVGAVVVGSSKPLVARAPASTSTFVAGIVALVAVPPARPDGAVVVGAVELSSPQPAKPAKPAAITRKRANGFISLTRCVDRGY